MGRVSETIAPRPEAEAAAAWWASRLGNATHDVGGREPGERQNSAFAFAVTALAGRTFSDEQREAFRRELADGIEQHLRKWETGTFEGGWRPGEPRWGSANRSFGCDYGPEPVLREAAERAGITLKSIDLPMKTCMQVNPGEVRVGEGYNAPFADAWRAP